jgi:DNA repair exonuclease SbcCD ATPase subunit
MEGQEFTNLLEFIRKGIINLNKTQVEAYKKIDDNFDSIDKRLATLEESISKLTEDSESSFTTVGKKIDELKYEVHKIQKVSNYSEEYENLMKIVK